MANETLALFCNALSRLTLKPVNDPDLLILARLLRASVGPLGDLIEGGEGTVSVGFDAGRLVLQAKTERYNVCERMI